MTDTDILIAPKVSMDRWGKDHWTTFAYVMTRLGGGQPIDHRRMRCHPELHPAMVVDLHISGLPDGSAYPTRLKDGAEVSPHDDWSCLEDAADAGLFTLNRWKALLGDDDWLRTTEAGRQLWMRFQHHIELNPRNWSCTFDPFAVSAESEPQP